MVLDDAMTQIIMGPEGTEGLVSTVGCTLWYVNFVENATIRILSSHTGHVNSLDTQHEISLRGSLTKSQKTKYSQFITCSNDNTVRVWSEDNYDQIVAFRQKVQPCVVKFSAFYPGYV